MRLLGDRVDWLRVLGCSSVSNGHFITLHADTSLREGYGEVELREA